jgi:hypothetical protein
MRAPTLRLAILVTLLAATAMLSACAGMSDGYPKQNDDPQRAQPQPTYSPGNY